MDAIKNFLNLMSIKQMESQILAMRPFLTPNLKAKIKKDKFLLFSYEKHFPRFRSYNLGDFIQTIATKNALLSLNPKATFEYFDRDSLISYYSAGGGKNSSLNALTPVIMQGWFAHSFHFLPNNQTLPIFVGTHFADSIRIFLENIITYYPWYFSNKSVGCRDLNTLMYCKSLGLNAYFSRCLTLTLPRRNKSVEKQAKRVFLVGIPNEMLKFIPNDLLNGALQVHQQLVFINDLVYENIEKVTLNLLETYKTQAKLIITCALHCASPAIAMGIPVVLIARNEENLQRFSALNGIVPIYTLEDLEKGRVDFAPKPLDIESLKQDMLENLRFSIKEAMGESVDKEALQTIRQRIADFTPKMIESQNTDSKLCGGKIES